MRKVLFSATVDYHIKAFHLPYLKWFKEKGWEVHIAAKGDLELPNVDKKYNLDIQRSPYNPKNLVAYKQLKSIIEENKYNFVHCHTPVGGVLTRLASRKARMNGTKVLYTAHGFHFCKGAPLINWLVYYPIERWLANYTDCLITINKEDYSRAVGHKFGAKVIQRVHGVGVDTEKFKPIPAKQKTALRQLKGYKEQDFLLFYAAEFNKNKNQQLLIRVMAELKDKLPQARLLLAGQGDLLEYCKGLAVQLGVIDKIDFLGYRNDIDELLPMCDVALASSLREGLPVNVMEAMASGLPVIATTNRGHDELIIDEKNGLVMQDKRTFPIVSKLKQLAEDVDLRSKMGAAGRQVIEESYSNQIILREMDSIYQNL